MEEAKEMVVEVTRVEAKLHLLAGGVEFKAAVASSKYLTTFNFKLNRQDRAQKPKPETRKYKPTPRDKTFEVEIDPRAVNVEAQATGPY